MIAVVKAAPTLSSDPWRWLDAEGWFAALINRETKVDIQAGVTTIQSRMAHIRELMIEHDLADRPMVPGKAETHRQFFLRLYGVALESPQELLL